jgi:hypothetical protein
MDPHDNWLELAALDVIGELTDQEHGALQGHLRECADCRTAVARDAEVVQDWLPPASIVRPIRSAAADERGRRDAFLARARGEGLRLSAEAGRPRRPWMMWRGGWNTAPVGAVAAIAAFMLVAVAAWWSWPEPAASPVRGAESAPRMADVSRENDQLKRTIAATQEQNAVDRQQLAAVEARGDEARLRVAQLEQGLASAQEQSARTRDELQRTKAEASDATERQAAELRQLEALRTQIDQVKSAHAADRAALMARQDQVEDLTRQMRLQEATVDRSRSLLTADRDIRDLMTARNLHIVDVHDTNAKGKTQKAFGRMFYTEGKSLIFYAYDLESPAVVNASFQVWGQKSGRPDDAVSLGILYSDDKAQQRWVMTSTDPKVLKEIDSIFVTVEASGGSRKPSSQRMMYAYLLNEPNHR